MASEHNLELHADLDVIIPWGICSCGTKFLLETKQDKRSVAIDMLLDRFNDHKKVQTRTRRGK